MDDERICPVCDRRNPEQEPVHLGCRLWLTRQLQELPGKLAQLAIALVPSAVPADDRVSTTRTGSPTGGRLDVLSITGPGSAHISDEAYAGMLQPQVRRWRTLEPGYVTWIDVEPPDPGDGRPFPVARTRCVARDIPVWHADVDRDEHGEPYTVVADDQVGALPIEEWAAEWAGMWQRRAGHARPGAFVSRARRNGKHAAAAAAIRQNLLRRRLLLHLLRAPGGPAAIVAGPMVYAAWRAWRANAVLRLDTHDDHDVLISEWWARFGETVDVPAVPPLRYLQHRVDAACDDPDGYALADFAAELRTATAEISRALGERSEHVWLGRCPAQIRNQATGDTRPCGAHLWHSPYVGTQYNGAGAPVGMRVRCPRCRSEWGPERVALLALAQQIREVWPVDRARSYTTAERRRLPVLQCPRCSSRVDVAWRDITADGDPVRRWRPITAACSNHCPEAQKVI